MSYTLDELCHIEKGKIGITKAVDGEYPLVTTGEDFGTHNEYHFEGPAVCVPLVSSTGHGHASIKRLHYIEGKFACGNILAVLIPKDPSKLSAKFLYTYLTVHKQEKLVRKMKGAANVSLTLTNLKKVKIEDLPSLKEQEKISSIYSSIDKFSLEFLKKIEFNKTRTSTLKNKVIDLAVFGHFLPYSNNDYSFSDDFDHLVPNKWSFSSLEDIAEFIDYRGKTPKKVDTGIRLVTAKNVKLGYFSYEPAEYMESHAYDDWMTRGFPQKNDVLFTTEAPLANTCLYPFEHTEKIALAQRIITLHPYNDSDYIKSRYLFYCLLAPSIRRKIQAKATGTAALGIRSSRLKKIIFPVPSQDEMLKIVNFLEVFFEFIEQIGSKVSDNEEIIDKLKNQSYKG